MRPASDSELFSTRCGLALPRRRNFAGFPGRIGESRGLLQVPENEVRGAAGQPVSRGVVEWGRTGRTGPQTAGWLQRWQSRFVDPEAPEAYTDRRPPPCRPNTAPLAGCDCGLLFQVHMTAIAWGGTYTESTPSRPQRPTLATSGGMASCPGCSVGQTNRANTIRAGCGKPRDRGDRGRNSRRKKWS